MTPQSLSRQSLPLAINRDGSGLSGVYADMHTAPSPSSGCRQSHSRAGPSTSVVATEVSHCVFACLPSGFRLRVFPFLDTSQNQRERAVYLRTRALVWQTKLLSASNEYETKRLLSIFSRDANLLSFDGSFPRVKQRAKLSRLEVETASKSFHLSM
jgi:hypothetical protein